jgi:serine/threonine protein kinase
MGWLDRMFGRKRQKVISATVQRAAEAAPPGWILRPGQVLMGNYLVQHMIGSPGGMGQVFAAEDMRLGLKVAIKVPALNILLAPNGAERFLREARIAAHLSPHPHIVQIKACLIDQAKRGQVLQSSTSFFSFCRWVF